MYPLWSTRSVPLRVQSSYYRPHIIASKSEVSRACVNDGDVNRDLFRPFVRVDRDNPTAATAVHYGSDPGSSLPIPSIKFACCNPAATLLQPSGYNLVTFHAVS